MTPDSAAAAALQVEALWTGEGFAGPAALELRGAHLVVATGLRAADRPTLRLGGTLFASLTDHHTHLGLVDPGPLFAGGITHAVDLGWVPSAASRWLTDVAGLPAIAIAGALLTAPGGYPARAGWAPPGAAAEVGGGREARETVRRQVILGASRIKVALNTDAGETVDDATLAAIVEESHTAGLPVVAHVQGAGQTERALQAGVDQLAHTPFSERLGDRIVAAAADAGMTWISTLDIHGWGRPTAASAVAVDNLRRFAALGGRVLYGTDLGNGDLPLGVNPRELAGLHEAGITGPRLLRTIAGDGVPDALGPRVAWVPTAPPLDDAALPAWLATARGVHVTDLPDLLPLR